MCGNGCRCVERRMPASSSDPISSALHMSLAGNKCPNLKNDDLDKKIIASSRRVLLSDVQFEAAGSYTNTVLDSLKTKYVLLNANIYGDNRVDIKVKNESKDEPPVPIIDSCNTVTVSSISGVPKKLKAEVTLPLPKRVLYPPEAIQLGWQTNTNIIGSGMVNLRNSCYLNSTLQALFHVPSFVNWILNDKIHSTKCALINGIGHTECLLCAVMKTLQVSQRVDGAPIKPVQIHTKLKLICKHLQYGYQEDAHEFLRYLIESMERSYLSLVQGSKLDNYSKETTPLNQIFGGYLRTEVTCLECRHVSTTFQHFQDLLLDIRTVSSVDDALEAYFGREELGEGEKAYRCEQCQRRVSATKKFSIQKAPNVLCIQLKRFGILGGKISKHVSLKEHLDLSEFIHSTSLNTGELSYKLVSLISHIGPSSSCGHYTAIASSPNGCFHLFDDSVVRPVTLHTVLNANAYVIIYELEPSSASRPVKPAPAFTLTSSTNGVNGKTVPNGLSSLPHSLNKSPSILSPKPERSAATNSSCAPPSQTQTPPLPQIAYCMSHQRNSLSPKQTKLSNGVCGPSKSLVPYTPNESSDSESENAAVYRSGKLSTPKENRNGVRSSPVNGLTKESVQKTLFSLCNAKKSSPLRESPTPSIKQKFIPSTSCVASRPIKVTATSTAPKNEKYTASSLSPTKKKLPPINEQSSKLVMNGWHVSESAGGVNGYGGSSSGAGGNWNVTPISKSRVNERVETITTEDSNFASSEDMVLDRLSSSTNGGDTTVAPRCLIDSNNNEQGDDNSNCVNSNSGESLNSTISSISSSNSSPSNVFNANDRSIPTILNNKPEAVTKMWDGSRSNETVNELLKLSHRGYGASNVTTWSGEKSEIEKEIENDKQESKKRSLQNLYDEDIDRGKVKKIKNYSQYGSAPRNGRRYNPFQDHQNRKNSWYAGHNNNNNSKRHLFYRSYNNIDRFRSNHHNHNSSYHNQNGYRNWRH